ncbi:glutamic acid-rich protein-like [Belonocnema kinseyi]|uniref:glutamic acid-rich protein-like n=1 Tax=Belonocnema kinseyi TaxID=2817044 RepID=UPI00143CE1A8|nr:glutamic acid-rich protein-like [Belonocnema kinseyi]
MRQAVTDRLNVSPEWYAENDTCNQHRLFATMTLFSAKIHRKCSLDKQADKQAELMKRRANAAENKGKIAEQKDSKKRTVAFEEPEVLESRRTEDKNSRKAHGQSDQDTSDDDTDEDDETDDKSLYTEMIEDDNSDDDDENWEVDDEDSADDDEDFEDEDQDEDP